MTTNWSSLAVITPAAILPISFEEAKAHLRIDADVTDHDQKILRCISSATQHTEDFLGRALLTQTLRLTLDEWPADGIIEIPKPPLQSVTSVKYIDDDGNQQTLSSASYVVHTDPEPGFIELAYGESWPSIRAVKGAIEVVFVAGATSPDAIRSPIKAAILLLVGHLFENSEATLIGVTGSPLPMGVDSLLYPYRIITI